MRELLQVPSSGAISCGLYRGAPREEPGRVELDVFTVNPEEPIEPAADGCPGGWYRTAFANSVAEYTRHRTEGGGRVYNPRFRSASMQIQEAVMYLEQEQERWQLYRSRVDADRWRARKKG